MILYLSYVILQIVFVIVLKVLIKKKIKLKWYYLLGIILCGSLINTILYKNAPPVYNAIFNLIYFLLLTKQIFRISYKDTLFYMVIVWIISPVLDIVVMNITKFLDKKNAFYNTDLSKISSTLLLLIVIYSFSKSNFINKILKKVKKFYDKQNFSTIKFIMLIGIYITLDGLCFYRIEHDFGKFILLIALSILFLLGIYIYFRYKISILKETNDLLIKNNDYILNLITEYRILKHNLTNQLLGLKTTANVKTKGLIDDIIKEYNESYETSCDITKIPSGLNGIVYEKLALYKDDKLNVFSLNKIEDNLLEKVSLRSYNLLCEAIGIALDNAMEASKESKEKIVYLYFNETEEEVKIKIENSYTGTIDLEEIGTINYTSKSKGHGLGLFSLIEKKKISIQNRIKNNFFATYITIEKEKQ